ncbi:hypothetical protein AB4Y64_05390 [Lysobacter sp. TAF61]|uniref:hypothetical protein n=1 Tax=Lysobacter sp. TAF61 TaxID=3233072 RepID=UPI003F97E119
MDTALALSALISTLLSALALYAGSRNCRWTPRPKHPRRWTRIGLSLAVVGLVLWMVLLGGGAGLCAMLGTWMLGLIVLPYLALRSPAGAGGSR